MINTKEMTVGEFRNLFLKENDEQANSFQKKFALLRIEADKMGLVRSFEGFVLVLIGKPYPGKQYCEYLVKNGLMTSVGSASNAFQQNSTLSWNYKIDEKWRNCIFGDNLGTKDGRSLSGKMSNFIKNDVNLANTIDACFNDLIDKLNKSTFSSENDINNRVSSLKSIYELFKMDIREGDDDMENGSENGMSAIEQKINKLVENNIRQIVLTGAPGTGKTYSAQKFADDYLGGGEINDKRYSFVQFHSSYDYTDFVEGLRPVEIEGKGIQFVKLDGTFKSFCRKVVEENEKNSTENKKYFFIIDEINRADLSKVFGELMFALEDSYRGKPFDTQYKNLPTYEITDNKAKVIDEDVFYNGFFIPENVYIIGTMNDIDRSVEAFDFALRRRFQWVEVKADEVMEDALINMQKNENINENIDLKNLTNSVNNLNKVISGDEGRRFGLTEAYHIGPAYLKTKEADIKSAKQEIWEYRIESIIKEYCRGYNDVNDFINKSCKNAFLGDTDGEQ